MPEELSASPAPIGPTRRDRPERRTRAGRPGGGATTLAQVAAAAGVSAATVSRVVNGSATVSPAHQRAVQEAVRALAYVPNRAARGLATRRTGVVVLAVRELVAPGVSDPYVASFITAASHCLIGTGVHLIVMVAQDETAKNAATSYIDPAHVDGALLLSVHATDPLPAHLLRTGLPFVVGGRPPMPLERCSYVDVDNVGGGELAALRMLELGRRHLGVVAGPSDMSVAADRLAGFRRGLASAGLGCDLVGSGDFTRDSGAAVMAQLLEREPRIDGVFALSDVMAIGALSVLRGSGRRVPEDVALIGFDDVEPARYAEPPLTTVHQPVQEMARLMVEALLAQVGGEGVAPPVVLTTHLVLRGSA